LATKKLFQLAKEIGIDSKVIVAKCQAEGIPDTVIKNHMSQVSVGLEMTIREWFSGGAGGTAVETAEKVDVEKAKTKKSAAKKATSDAPSVNAPPAVADAKPTEAKPTDAAAADAKSADGKSKVVAKAKVKKADDAAPPAEPTSEAKPEVAPPQATTAPTPQPAAKAKTSALFGEHGKRLDVGSKPVIAPKPVGMPVPEHHKATPIQSSAPLPEAPKQQHTTGHGSSHNQGHGGSTHGTSHGLGTSHGSGHGPSHGPTHGSGHAAAHAPGTSTPGSGHAPTSGPSRPQQSRAPVAPAPMNVPTRPTVIAPAGPRLEVKTPVKLSGPKVVRVEAPDVVEAPRSRGPRPPMSGGGGGGGMRTGGGAGTSDDDRRNARRKEIPGTTKRSSGAGVPDRRRGRSDGDWMGTTQGIYSEQDLIEREARLARAGGFLKKRKQDLARSGANADGGEEEILDGRVHITAPFTLKELSAVTGVKAAEISKKLFLQGVMLKINDPMPVEIATEVMMDFEVELVVEEAKTAEETVSEQFIKRENKGLKARGPVVTILGHVDHGKTSLLDRIRNANVAAGEAGGITQKTSAFVSEVDVEGDKKQIVFLDTPGHEAFTGMRARGAKVTDVVVLVVSAPEGVMPQTIESINHAKAAKVPIVVALNKIDRPDATESQIQKTLGQLAAADLNVVEWGGDVECVRVSAQTGEGIPKLLEVLDLQASVLELTADFEGPAQGTVVEAKMEEGRGAVANVLIQHGKLKVGDFVVMGRAFGRVRDITDDKGKRIKEALPPMPVQISGMDQVCDAGDKFYVTSNLKQAEEAADQRRQRERHNALAAPKLTLDSLFGQLQQQQGDATEIKEIKIVLKTDQQGTVDVLKNECEKIKTSEVKVRVIDAAVGGITESNVLLADASKAIVIGFNVIPSGKARQLAEQKGVEIRTYQVIYDITDDLKKAAEGMLTPEVREEVLGHADVRAVFKVSKVGNVAGCYVTDGVVQRDALIRVTRNGVVIEHDRKLSQLKRVKDDAKEVRSGTECGMKIDGYDDIKEGDVLECYKKTEVKRTL
jgi:translation initiation factor IF-2